MTGRICVCVPARDEAERLPVLLTALAGQTMPGPIPVVLCINNSRDGSAAVARRLAADLAGRIDLHVIEREFPDELAHVGSARRCAMDAGAALLGDAAGILLTTDADCRPPARWMQAVADAMADDLIVGGRIVIDEAEPIGPAQQDIRERLDRYWEQVRAIEDDLDPQPWDRPPRHGDHTGASLAMTVSLYRAAGGVPLLACGEDRALVENARLAGGRLVHPITVWTRCSPRTVGRAPGGMAAAMAAIEAAEPCVPALDHWRTRALWRRQTRAEGEAAVIAAERLLPPMLCDRMLSAVVA